MIRIFSIICILLFNSFFQAAAKADILIVNTSAKRALMKLTKGKKISAKESANPLTFRAVMPKSEKKKISSVTFDLSGTDSHKNTEKTAPYCFLGNDGKKCNRGKKFASGKYTLKVTKTFKSGKRSVEKIGFSVASNNNSPGVSPTVPGVSNPPKVPSGTYDFPIAVCGKVPCQFPNAQNTGLLVSKSALKVVRGSVYSKQNGEVIQNLHVKDGNIQVTHDNVTVRNVYIDDGSLKVEEGANNWLFEHIEIYAPNQGNHIVTSRGGSGTARFIYAHHGSSDFLRPGSNQIYECNYVTDLGMGEDSHADVVQFYTSSDTTYENTHFRYNNFEIKPQNCSGSNNPNCEKNSSGYRSNTLLITSGNASTKNIHFDCNWNLNGGGYTMYANGGKYISSAGDYSFVIRNNLFGCNYKFGLTTGYDRNKNLWSGNIDVCSGKGINR